MFIKPVILYILFNANFLSLQPNKTFSLSRNPIFPVNLPCSFGLDPLGRTYAEADGVWEIVLVIFLVYAMLPLKTALAFGAGVALPVAHMAVAAAVTTNELGWKWQQVRKLCC